MLPSGAHIRIGEDEFFLAEELPQHYEHTLADAQTFFSVQEAGPRVQHATLFHNNRYWYMSDWTSGEGSEEWGTQTDNNGYDQSYANTRVPGRVTTRPTRADVTTDFTSRLGKGLQFAIGAGQLWVTAKGQAGGAQHCRVWYSSNGTSFTGYDVSGAAGAILDSMVGDGPYLYVAYHTTAPKVGHLVRLTASAASATGVAGFLGADSISNLSPGMAVANGTLYRWTGNQLRSYDTTNSAAFPYVDTATNLLISITDDPTVGAPDYADIVLADNTVCYMRTHIGDTRIYQYANGAHRQIWQMPAGFTGRNICFQAGLLFISGDYSNRAALFVLSLQTLQSTFVGYIRPWKAGTITALGNGPGSQVLMTHSSEGIFVYDYLADAISSLDYHYAGHTNNSDLSALDTSGSDVTTFLGNRYAALELNATDFEVSYWANDLTPAADSSTSTVLYEPSWDYGFSMASKTFLGIEVTALGQAAADSIKIEYKLEENGIYGTFPSSPSSGTWTTLGIMNLPNPVTNSDTIQYFDTTTTIGQSFKFRRLRWRFTLTGNPILKNVAARIEMPPGQETFNLLVRLRDEVSGLPGITTRPGGRQKTAQELRQVIWGYIRDKLPVTFLDGYPYRAGPPQYDTYQVVVEEPMDDIDVNSQGEMKLTLRRVDGNSLA